MVQKRSSTLVKYFVASFVGVALYCELFVYVVQPFYWPHLQCHSRDPSCTRILFVADPQIQGDYEFPAPLNYVSEWDSDRYLKSTFSVVMSHFQPHILVYLGDLMDEGSVSTQRQFHEYVKRLADIFNVNYHLVQVWLPGDNDIGGEGGEAIRKDKILEFDKVFQQPDVVTARNVSFYKVNGITHTYPKLREEDEGNVNLRMVVSHYPVTNSPVFGQEINKAIRPHIYFSAHNHESRFVKQNDELNHRVSSWLKFRDLPLEINVKEKDERYEISVPTCSYRMGTDKIGFGAAVLGNNNQHMKYTVFWSPTRFPYLFLYVLFSALLMLYFCTFVLGRIYSRCREKTTPVSSMYPFTSVAYEKV